MEQTTLTMRAIVGRNVRRIRDESGVTAEEVSKKLRHMGLKWTPSRISELERGLKAVSLAEMVALSFALGSKNSPVRLSDLFQGNENVELSPTMSTTAKHLREILGGAPVSQGTSNYPEMRQVTAATFDRLPVLVLEMAREFTRYGGPDDFEILERITEGAGAAEAKAAKALGISESALLGAAAALWGRSLTLEREARAASAASTQNKGHVTRQLMSELRSHLEKFNGDD